MSAAVKLTVQVTAEHLTGRFVSKDDLADALASILEGEILTAGDEDSEYEVVTVEL